jgi:hypothetical protein
MFPTSSGFWDPQMWQIRQTTLIEKWKTVSSLKHALLTYPLPLSIPDRMLAAKSQCHIFLHFLKQLQFVCLQCLAAHALHCRLLNDEFEVHGSLTKWTSVGFTGKLPKWLQLVYLHLWSTTCTMFLKTPILQQMLVPINNCVWWIMAALLMKPVLNSCGKLKFCQSVTA